VPFGIPIEESARGREEEGGGDPKGKMRHRQKKRE